MDEETKKVLNGIKDELRAIEDVLAKISINLHPGTPLTTTNIMLETLNNRLSALTEAIKDEPKSKRESKIL